MEHFLWTEAYRPARIQDCILPDRYKKTFQQFIDQKNIPNLLLSGSAGVGKTTVARAMLEELGADYYVVNGSLEGRSIDTLRNEIANFASSMSLMGGRKYVILDESDYLNPQSVQPALRNFMEDLSVNCGFILTCNFKNKIIEPLRSRCSLIEFKINKEDKPKIAGEFFKRVQSILDMEKVEYDPKVVAEVVKKHFPDFRRVLNELQTAAASGKIDNGILSNSVDSTIDLLIDLMKDKNYTAIRKWIAENSDVSIDDLFKKFYDTASEKMTPGSIPELILILAEYQYKSAFVASQEINLAACFANIMTSCNFK